MTVVVSRDSHASATAQAWLAAAANGDLAGAAALLRAGACCGWHNGRGQQALHLALVHRHEELAHLLMGAYMAQGEDLSAPAMPHRTPLGLAIEHTLIVLARDLMSAGVDPAQPVAEIDGLSANAWLWAVHLGHMPIVRDLSTQAPELKASTLIDGRGALHLATAAHDEVLLGWLLLHGCPADLRTQTGALAWQQPAPVKILEVWKGAIGLDRLLEDEGGPMLLHLALEDAKAGAEDAEVVDWLLAHRPHWAHRCTPEGVPPLMLALRNRRWAAVDQLVAAGASWHTPLGTDPQATPAGRYLKHLDGGVTQGRWDAWCAAAQAQALAGVIPPAPAPPTSVRL